LLGNIAEYETALAANANTVSGIPAPAAAAPGGPPSSTSGASGPGLVPGKPLFRQPKPGEHRLEAIFEKSECVVGKGITFYFKAADETVTATAAKFDDVEFITFRDDLKGTITCGPVKDPMPVYMTWRAGQAPGSKIVVAIEFLPKTYAER
jgi:hypothetical protein